MSGVTLSDLDRRGLAPYQIPWWAVSVLDLQPGSDRYRVRRLMQSGLSRHVTRTDKVLNLWQEVVKQARDFASLVEMDDLVRAEPERCRHGALTDVRAFYQFTDIRDDMDQPVVMADFHVRGVRAMRTQKFTLELWPFGHGKSWHSSVTVPLMDWAEWPEFTETRTYFNPGFQKLWMRTLMYLVEHSDRLHALFPWVDKPGPDDPCHGIWSLDGFCVKGKSKPVGQYSFEGFTWNAGVVGRRGMRNGCDDWVNSDNARSETVQEGMWEYFFKGPMTFVKPVPFASKGYETKASTVFVVGTLFEVGDFNNRLKERWRSEGKMVHLVDVFTDDTETEVIWPWGRDLAWVEEQRSNSTPEAFNARVRNRIFGRGQNSWTENMISEAERPDLGFGQPVETSGDIWIGFDPASGKRTKYSKYPAFAVLQFDGAEVHIVEWGRWSVHMPEQVARLCELSRRYNLAPIAVEDASQQTAYRPYIALQDPHVQVVTHSTTARTKRDWRNGVESLIPLWQNRSVSVHTGGAPKPDIDAIRKELKNWRGGSRDQGGTTDIIMAVWIAKFQHDLAAQRNLRVVKLPVPAYASRSRMSAPVLDLRSLREGVRRS